MRMPPQLTDAEIIAVSLDEPARFDELVRAYLPRIARYLARRVGPTVAEDLTSETFVKAFRGRRTYRGDQPTALPWLYRIATNVVRSHVRSEERRIELLGRVAAQAVYAEAVTESVDEAITAAATLQQLAGALQHLSADARELVLLVAVEELTYQEAAVVLDVPVGTVRSRLSRARRDLRQMLDGPPTYVPDQPATERGAPHA